MVDNEKGGITFGGLLTVVFIALKLSKVIDWSWVWVLSPIWVPIILVVVAVLIMAVIESILKD